MHVGSGKSHSVGILFYKFYCYHVFVGNLTRVFWRKSHVQEYFVLQSVHGRSIVSRMQNIFVAEHTHSVGSVPLYGFVIFGIGLLQVAALVDGYCVIRSGKCYGKLLESKRKAIGDAFTCIVAKYFQAKCYRSVESIGRTWGINRIQSCGIVKGSVAAGAPLQ